MNIQNFTAEVETFFLAGTIVFGTISFTETPPPVTKAFSIGCVPLTFIEKAFNNFVKVRIFSAGHLGSGFSWVNSRPVK